MVTEHIDLILYVTGGITVSMFLQFLAPQAILRTFYKLPVEDPTTIFFARLWALVIALFGALLIWAGYDPALRTPLTVIVALGKTIHVVMILMNRKTFARGFLHVAAFDTLCTVLYVSYLAGL